MLWTAKRLALFMHQIDIQGDAHFKAIGQFVK